MPVHLHSQLTTDCHRLGEIRDHWLLLHRNASLPWFILVPDTQVTGLYEMPAGKRHETQSLWNDLACWVHQYFQCTRVNMAAIGNVVPQLHLHVVGRTETDPLWPGVVWGRPLPNNPWREDEIREIGNAAMGSLGPLRPLPSDP